MPGSAPRPGRTGPAWKQFLTARARGILAANFVHMDKLTSEGGLLGKLTTLVGSERAAERPGLTI